MSDTLTVEEKYAGAVHASNLRIEAEKGGAVDVLTAAGWSASRLGAALLRLKSEFDGTQKPKSPAAEFIKALVGTKQAPSMGCRPALDNDGKPMALTLNHAKEVAHDWHLHEQRIMLGKLKTLPEVRIAVTAQAARWRMAPPESIAAMVILHWLTPQCQSCGGLGEKQIAETPALTGKPCKPCNGSGVAACPGGGDGRKLANWLDSAVSEAQSSIKRRLRAMK